MQPRILPQRPAGPPPLTRLLLSLLACVAMTSGLFATDRPLVIAHRGASGYLPEHTLESAAYAHALGADFIEQDVVLSKDDVLVVSHDIHVDTITDAAARFPDRRRANGRFYAIDFTWAELRSLKVSERTAPGGGPPVFPRRFPSRPDDGAAFRLCTLEEQIALIHGLNVSTGRRVGLYPEIKAPAFHRREGRDPGAALLALLRRHDYTGPRDPVFVQCFDPAELKRLRTELGCQLRLIQLIGDNGDEEGAADYEAMRTPAGLRKVARYADGIGPHLGHIAAGIAADGRPRLTTLVADAHAAGLLVHPYTFRRDALPAGVPTIDALLAVFLDAARVDGVFIDQPDAAVRFLAQRPTPATR